MWLHKMKKGRLRACLKSYSSASGESYRLREKKQAGLIGVGAAALTGPRDDAANDNPPGVGQFQTGEGGSKVRRR